MRKYEPIWIALKTHGSASINAPVKSHPLIVRMVCKEKWLDKKFNKKEGWRMKYITYRIHENTIHFSLDYRTTEITGKDL